MKRCCPQSCRSGSFFKSDCKKDGGKGSCKYPNKAQPEETPCKNLCKAKDSDACLKASGENWSKYTCSKSTKWCKSWGKDMKRCCPESCETESFSESDCKEDGGKGNCKYPNEAQPDETQCKKGKDDFIVLIVISLHSLKTQISLISVTFILIFMF